MAAAVFRRGDALWCVFDQPSRQNLAALRAQGGGRITEVEQRPHDRATILRLATVANVEPQVERDGLAWIVRLGASWPAAGEPIVPVIDSSPEVGARLLLPVAEPGAPIAVSDPEVGDNLVIVPVIPLASRLARAFDYPQFRLPATSQGIVVTIPAGAFGTESEGFLRISFCADEAKLSEGVRRLGEGLKSLR